MPYRVFLLVYLNGMVLGSYFEGFMAYLRFEKRLSTHTLIAYSTDLNQFATFFTETYGELPGPASVSRHHLRSWLVELKNNDGKLMSATTRNRKISTISTFFRYLMRQGVIKNNPVRQLHSLKLPQRVPEWLKPTDIEELLEETAFGEGLPAATDRLICELLYRTGMRRQELIGLKETDVEWHTGQLRVLGKGNKERLIPISHELRELLRDYIAQKKAAGLAGADALLVLGSGRPLYPNYVYRVMTTRLGAITTLTKHSPHVMRHTFATHLLNNGANIQAIKDLLGHSSLAATQVYTHTNIERLKDIHKKTHPRG